MQITVRRAVDNPRFAELEAEYREMGWPLAQTPTGLSVVAGDSLCGIELFGDRVAELLRLMYQGSMTWPTLDLPGNRRLVILARAPKGDADLRALRAARATVRWSGLRIPLPPTVVVSGPVRWVVPPRPSSGLPTVEAVTEAIQVANSRQYLDDTKAAS